MGRATAPPRLHCVKNRPENKKPATSEIAGDGLPKSELCLSYVCRITHPRQRWFSQQQAHSRQLLARVEASMSKCYLRSTIPFTSDAGEAEKIHCYQGLSPPSTRKRMMFRGEFECSRADATLWKWTSTRSSRKQRPSLKDTFGARSSEGKSSVALGGSGVVVSGCEACRKRFGTNSRYLRHLADDVLLGIIEGALSQ
jgi:hypothetical protein